MNNPISTNQGLLIGGGAVVALGLITYFATKKASAAPAEGLLIPIDAAATMIADRLQVFTTRCKVPFDYRQSIGEIRGMGNKMLNRAKLNTCLIYLDSLPCSLDINVVATQLQGIMTCIQQAIT